MSAMTNRSYKRLSTTLQRLSIDAPQVIGARVAMLSGQGAGSARDQAELSRMLVEKHSAATESWLALWSDAAGQCQQAGVRFWSAFFSGNVAGMLAANALSAAASMASANRMLKPYQRRATANARRLSKR
jgi:hypothetical protein